MRFQAGVVMGVVVERGGGPGQWRLGTEVSAGHVGNNRQHEWLGRPRVQGRDADDSCVCMWTCVCGLMAGYMELWWDRSEERLEKLGGSRGLVQGKRRWVAANSHRALLGRDGGICRLNGGR